jgi:hypothetical protein
VSSQNDCRYYRQRAARLAEHGYAASTMTAPAPQVART